MSNLDAIANSLLKLKDLYLEVGATQAAILDYCMKLDGHFTQLERIFLVRGAEEVATLLLDEPMERRQIAYDTIVMELRQKLGLDQSDQTNQTEPVVEAAQTEPVVEAAQSEPVVEAAQSEPVDEANPTEPVDKASPTEPVPSRKSGRKGR